MMSSCERGFNAFVNLDLPTGIKPNQTERKQNKKTKTNKQKPKRI